MPSVSNLQIAIPLPDCERRRAFCSDVRHDISVIQLRVSINCIHEHGQMLPHGLEPWTSRLLAERSNQLSYESKRAQSPSE